MKAIKDKIVLSDAYYFVLDYLHATDFHPIMERGLCEYDKMTGRPIFKMEMVDYATFTELFREGMDWMLGKSEDLTLENIDKFNLN
jgi:hypothetical protein